MPAWQGVRVRVSVGCEQPSVGTTLGACACLPVCGCVDSCLGWIHWYSSGVASTCPFHPALSHHPTLENCDYFLPANTATFPSKCGGTVQLSWRDREKRQCWSRDPPSCSSCLCFRGGTGYPLWGRSHSGPAGSECWHVLCGGPHMSSWEGAPRSRGTMASGPQNYATRAYYPSLSS